MAKLTLGDVASIGGNPTSAAVRINNNNSRLEVALENTLSRDGSQPNQMEADFDLNHYDLLNADEIHADHLFLDGYEITPQDDFLDGSAFFVAEDLFVADGTQVNFELSQAPGADENVILWIGGAIQDTEEYSLNGSTLTIPGPVEVGLEIRALTIATVTVNEVARLRDETLEARDIAVAAAEAAAGSAGATLTQQPYPSQLSAISSYHPVAAPDILEIGGYAESGDGGDSLWRKKPDDEPDEPGQFSITLDGGDVVRYGYMEHDGIDVNAFGADQNGILNSTPAIQTAVDFAIYKLDLGHHNQDVIGNGLYLVDDTVTIERETQFLQCNTIIKLAGVKASDTFPIGKPIFHISKFAWASGVEDTVIDGNYRADAILHEGGVAGSAQARISGNEIKRCKDYHVHVGTSKFTLSPGHTIGQWATVTFTSGATGRVCRVSGNDIWVDKLVHMFSNLPQIGNTVTGTGPSGSGVLTTRRDLGSNQAYIKMNILKDRQNGDPDFFESLAKMPVGVWGVGGDVKIKDNIISRCGGYGNPSVRVDGYQWLISGNHTFPIPAYGAPQYHSNWYTNYEVWYGGNVFTSNYIDNGCIDFRRSEAASCVVDDNLYSKFAEGAHGNDAGIRIWATSVGETFSQNDLYYGGSTYGGNGNGDLKTQFRYWQPDGNSFLNTITIGYMLRQSEANISGRTIANLGSSARPLRLMTATETCRLSFENTGSDLEFGEFGTEGNFPSVWRNNSLVLQFDDDGANFRATPIHNARWRVKAGENTGRLITNTDSFCLLAINVGTPQTFTLPNTAFVGTVVKFHQKGAGTITLSPESGGLLLGSTSSRTLTRWYGCTAICTGGSAGTAEWTLEGTFT